MGWHRVAVVAGDTPKWEDGEPVADIGGVLLIYPRTREICHIEGGRQSRLPPGTVWLQEGERRRFSLERSALAPDGPLAIVHAASPVRPDDPSYYATTLTNVSSDPVRVTSFGGFVERWFRLRLNTVTGDMYTAEQFADWYGVRDEDGWIGPGAAVTDHANYGGPGSWWVYFGVRRDGRAFTVGRRSG